MKRYRFFFLLSVAFCLSVFSPSKAEAAVKTWNPTGCASSSWNVAGNWSGGLPGTGDVATFDGATSNCPVTVNTSIDVGGINITGGYTGTITQGNGNAINIRASGYTQNASGSTFTGGNASSSIMLDNNGGDFTLTAGTFTASSGTFLFHDNFTINGGTFNSNSGKVEELASADNSATITGSATFYDFQIDNDGGNETVTFAAGTTITVTHTLYLDDGTGGFGGTNITGTGGITALGDISTTDGSSTSDAGGIGGDAAVTISGTADQNLIGMNTGRGRFPSLVINKTSGTLNITGNFYGGNFTYTAGSYNINTSSFNLQGSVNITGSFTFYDLDIDNGACTNDTMTVASGTTITITHKLYLDDDSTGCGGLGLNGPGVFVVTGDIDTNTTDGIGGDIAITMSGGADQTIKQGTSGDFPSGTFTINKSAGTVTLVSPLVLNSAGQDFLISAGFFNESSYNLTVDDILTINGQFIQTSGNLNTGSVAVGSKGVWQNNSTGGITLGGNVSNTGSIHLDGNGSTCGDSDAIQILSSSNGVQRTWSGAGTFVLNDLNVKDQGGTMTTYSSTSVSGNGWTFNSSCPPYSNKTDVKVGGGTKITGGTKLKSY